MPFSSQRNLALGRQKEGPRRRQVDWEGGREDCSEVREVREGNAARGAVAGYCASHECAWQGSISEEKRAGGITIHGTYERVQEAKHTPYSYRLAL